jgi:hypothetical protein
MLMLILSMLITLPEIGDKLLIWQDDSLLVQSEKQLYLVDPAQGRVHPFVTLPPGVEILATQHNSLIAFDNAGHLLVLVESPKRPGSFDEKQRIPIGNETEIVSVLNSGERLAILTANSIGEAFSLGVPSFRIIALQPDGSITLFEDTFERQPRFFTLHQLKNRVMLFDEVTEALLTFDLETGRQLPAQPLLPFPKAQDKLHRMAIAAQGQLAISLRRHDHNGEFVSNELRLLEPDAQRYKFIASHLVTEGLIENIVWRPDSSSFFYELNKGGKTDIYLVTRHEDSWEQKLVAVAPDPVRYVWLTKQLAILTEEDQLSIFNLDNSLNAKRDN